MQTPFTEGERRELLNRYSAAHQRWLDLDFQSVTGKADASATAGKDRLAKELDGLLGEYRRNVPVLPLSRCPFSQQVLYHSLDPYGTDGLWWNYQAPVRPLDPVMPTFHSLTGALLVQGPVEKAPFLCVPGPGAPYVVPAILADDRIRAVISETRVGEHTGYVIAYFSSDPAARIPRLNSWGANRWQVLDRRGTFLWGEYSPPATGLDFDLKRWLDEEKLFWIAPGDRLLALHRGAADCPYCAGTGTRQIQRIRNGVLLDGSEKEGR